MINFQKAIFIIFLLGWSAALQAQEAQLARVSKIQGLEAYFLSEPLRDYEVVLNRRSGPKVTSLLTRGLINESVSDKASLYVRRAIRKAEKKGQSIDALVYTGGKRAIAVKFTEAASAENKGIARVKSVNGLDVYVFAEPLSEYEVVTQKNGGLKWKSALTAGLLNNSIEDDVAQFARRVKRKAEKNNQAVNSIIYSGGKSSIGAQLK